MFTGFRVSLLVAALAVSAGCASLPGGGSTPLERAEYTVEVDNRNFADANVYAIAGGRRQRIGRVTGKTIRKFTFDWEHESLQMLVDFTAGRPAVSGTLAVTPGATPELLLVIGSASRATVTLSVNTR